MSTAYPQPPVPSPQPPSRRDNPFATCWTKPGALAFRFADGQNVEQLISKLAAQDWFGAIEGPHGSGKSTFLESLKPALAAGGRHIISLSLHDGQRRLPPTLWNALNINTTSEKCLVIIDGYEQLSWFERLRLTRSCSSAGAGLLVTTHASTRVPTLIHLAPSHELVSQLVADLCAEVSTLITSKDVAASHASHGSNVREIFFDLYDRYERRRRAKRTYAAAATY
jgi:hypothetical protein